MKDIKFRVYDKQSNEMIYLESPSTYDNGLWFKSDKHIDSEDIVIMQFTGLTDCEGKEIFEGDIIKNKIYDFCLKVCWDNNYCGFSLVNKKFVSSLLDYEPNIYYKIVGNIHQNSELLEINK